MFVNRLINDTAKPINEVGLFDKLIVDTTQSNTEIISTIQIETRFNIYNTMIYFSSAPSKEGYNNLYTVITSLQNYGTEYGLFINFDYLNNYPNSSYNLITKDYGVDYDSAIKIPKECDIYNKMTTDGDIKSSSLCQFKLKLNMPNIIIPHIMKWRIAFNVYYVGGI